MKTLELCYSGVKDAHLAKLVDLPALQEINLDSCPVGDWAIAHLADNDVVPNLTSLDLADTDLTGRFTRAMTTLSSLFMLPLLISFSVSL